MKHVQIFIACILINVLLQAQPVIDIEQQLKSPQPQKDIHAEAIITPGSEWTELGVYSVGKDSLFEDDHVHIEVINKHKVNFITDHDKLNFKGADEFQLIYGGHGPERQTYKIISYNNGLLLLESTFKIKGYYGFGQKAKRIYKETDTARYLWQKTN